MNPLLIPYAIDDRGEIVHVDNVPNGKASGAYCPGCTEPLIAKNGGTIKVHHFAHSGGNNCESMLHSVAKRLIARGINEAVEKEGGYVLRYPCQEIMCGDIHSRDILARGKITHASIETWLPENQIRPDIVCFDDDKKPRLLIEVVYTHSPEYNFSNVGVPVAVHDLKKEDGLFSYEEPDIRLPVKLYGFPCTAPYKQCKVCNAKVHFEHMYYPAWLSKIFGEVCRDCEEKEQKRMDKRMQKIRRQLEEEQKAKRYAREEARPKEESLSPWREEGEAAIKRAEDMLASLRENARPDHQ